VQRFATLGEFAETMRALVETTAPFTIAV